MRTVYGEDPGRDKSHLLCSPWHGSPECSFECWEQRKCFRRHLHPCNHKGLHLSIPALRKQKQGECLESEDSLAYRSEHVSKTNTKNKKVTHTWCTLMPATERQKQDCCQVQGTPGWYNPTRARNKTLGLRRGSGKSYTLTHSTSESHGCVLALRSQLQPPNPRKLSCYPYLSHKDSKCLLGVKEMATNAQPSLCPW